jgi:hypothetical protein
MSPDEICRRLGEAKVKTIFLELTTDAMKKVLREAKLPTTRLASHTSTRRRNEDWAAKLWRAVSDKPATSGAATLLFEWLTRGRRAMLAEFLTGIDVKHEGGLTDADFMSAAAPEKLREVGRRLLEKGQHDRQEVAAYLLFLDASNKSEVFAELELEPWLAPREPATAQAP